MTKKILLVEDDLLAAAAYRKQIERLGYAVELAIDGLEAISKSKDGFHCIILDVSLPKIGGWDVLNKLKDDSETKDIPVLIYTVLDGIEYRAKAEKLGAHAFVNKTRDNLISEIEKILPLN